MAMVERTEYLDWLSRWRDSQVIKVITGIRRCGKSTLLKMFQDRLEKDGVAPQRIIAINFEDLANESLCDYKTLYLHIRSLLQQSEMNYVFLDEIQRVEHFEKTVDSLHIMDNVDIYITGSNSYLLSGELATLLSGRFVELSIQPFSFFEYRCAFPEGSDDSAFSLYLREGGFPYLARLGHDTERINTYLEGIYNTIIVKDIESREHHRQSEGGRRRVSDFGLLRMIAKFLASTIGSPVSYKSITDYIASSGRKISQNTVADYVEMLREAFVFYPVERFNIAGKQLLKTNQKIYIADLGIRHYLLPRSQQDLGFCLENAVYLELRRRGYHVYIGKQGDNEVDFVTRKGDILEYFQITASLLEPSTFEREIRPLRSIRDNHSKTILTLDRFTAGNYDGIRVVNAVDWLLRKGG